MKTPLSPEARALARLLSTRRSVLGAGALVLAGGALAACGTKGTSTNPSGSAGPKCTPAADVSASERRVVFSNWTGYLDEDEKNVEEHPTLKAFTTKTGIEVKYTADINDNNEFYGKIRAQLAACQTIDRDIVVFTDWMAARFIRNGWAQKLSLDKAPNFVKNLAPSMKGRDFDPKQEYAMPWQAGMTGIAVNTNVTKEVRTIDELLTRPDLKGKVTCLTEMHDTMGLLLLSMDKDPANFTAADFDAALEKLKKAVASGQIRRFTGNDYKEELPKGDIAACIAWSGDVIQLATEDEKIKFITPDEGMLIWSDNALIPQSATHAANAQAVLDHYYDPKVAAELAAFVNYVCPVVGAQEAMKDVDPDLVENPLIFPDAEMQKKLKVFKSLSDTDERDYQRKFQAAIGA
ncbi:MAG TPA: ABC transporter substrate-binding protein [Micromonosporaceae bacterium]|nr:ABC transporter substrate-binding protein [Micromonosporaceae bacterium]